MTFSGQTTRSTDPGWIVLVAARCAGEHLPRVGVDRVRALFATALHDRDPQRRRASDFGAVGGER